MDNVSQGPILAEFSISSQNGSTFSKKWKKSTFIFGGIMGLVVLIPIVFSIVNMVENSRLEAKLELEAEKNAKTMEANLNNIQSQLDHEIETREQENETLFVALIRVCECLQGNGIQVRRTMITNI